MKANTEKAILDFNNLIENNLSESLKGKKVSPFQRSAAYGNLNNKIVANILYQPLI